MKNEETLLKWYFSVRDDGKILNPDEIHWILDNALKTYDEKLFSNGVFCLSLGSSYFKNHPNEIKRLFRWNLDDYDLGQLYDAIKYSGLTGLYIDVLLSKISFDNFRDDWEYSVISALNTIADYIYSANEKVVYESLQNEFKKFIKTLDSNKLNETEIAFLNFFYRALLHAKHGKESNKMTFDLRQIIRRYSSESS